MTEFDFDSIVERRGTGALKYDALSERYGHPDLLPLWVADMDFPTPRFIVDAMEQRLKHPIYGYNIVPQEFWDSIITWLSLRHDWKVKKEWLNFIPGIVKGIGLVINLFSDPGDKIIIQSPVYHPFRLVPEGNGRKIVDNPLLMNPEGRYEMNFDELEKIVKDEECKILILSNPHNPAGIIWTKETLERVADICYEKKILVISDEIHADMALWGKEYTPFPKVSEKAARCSITFGAPSKTFNIAGIVSSFAVVSNEEIREKFYHWLDVNEFSEPSLFSIVATISAFKYGNEWREKMLAYVEENILFVEQFCKDRLPGIKPLIPDASFLVWLDCRGLKLSHDQLINLFVNKAQLALNDGEMFGPGGEGFMRMNVGCPRKLVEEAMLRLYTAIYNINY